MARSKTPEPMTSLGLKAWTGEPVAMSAFHRHDDIEGNYLHTGGAGGTAGGATYLFGGSRIALEPGRLVVFWAALPHLLVEVQPGTRMSWFTLPLSWLLHWRLPEGFMNAMLSGAMMSDGRTDELDPLRLGSWERCLSSGGEVGRQVVALELEARIRRMTMSSPARVRGRAAARSRHRADEPQISKVDRMAGFVAAHYTQPIAVADIAEHVNLHPHYAMTLFRQVCGLSLMDYVLRHRISHAQRLLARTDRAILDIAMDAGFGSLSRFYNAFGIACGCTPRAYRQRMRE